MEESNRDEGVENVQADSAVEEHKAVDSQDLILIGLHRQITFL